MALITSSSSIDVTILLTLVSLLVYYLATKNYSYWKQRGVPSLKPIPFIGNVLTVFRLEEHLCTLLERLYFKFKGAPYFGIYIFNQPFLVLRDLDLIQKILIKDFNKFSDHVTFADHDIDSITAKMIFFERNPTWRKTRTKVSPIFSMGKVRVIYSLLIPKFYSVSS